LTHASKPSKVDEDLDSKVPLHDLKIIQNAAAEQNAGSPELKSPSLLALPK